MRKGRDGEKKTGKKRGGKKKIRMKIVAERWNAARSRQKIIRACKKTLLTEIDISSEMQQNCILPSLIYDIYFIFDNFDQFEGDFLNQ